MSVNTLIRVSGPAETDQLAELYREAFPAEELLPLVRGLLADEQPVLSLAVFVDRLLAGHVIFTPCCVSGRIEKAALLGPLAVAPQLQKKGIGSALVREGFRRLKTDGLVQVLVLGDPAYYGRFGFAADDAISPPYPLPTEWRGAWQSTSLGNCQPALRGALCVPKPWFRPELWAL